MSASTACSSPGARRGPARIVALEPHPRTFAKLDFNCRCNGFDRITRLNVGVAAESGVMALHSDGGGNIGNASLLAAVGKGREQVRVAVRPLVEILNDEGITQVDLMKIDVEGYEDRALAPFLAEADAGAAARAICCSKPCMRNSGGSDLRADLLAAGYRVVAETEENLLLSRQVACPGPVRP